MSENVSINAGTGKDRHNMERRPDPPPVKRPPGQRAPERREPDTDEPPVQEPDPDDAPVREPPGRRKRPLK